MYATRAALIDAIVAEAANRDDVRARCGEFVAMAERRMFSGLESLRCREMETRATVTFSGGVGALPANFLQARRMTWDGSQPYPLVYRQPEEFYIDQGPAGQFTIDGNVIDVGGKPSGQATLSYYAKPAPLLLDTDTNPILLAHGHVYLYAALIEVYAYLRNTAKAEESAMRFQSAIGGVNETAVKARYSGTHLAPRIPGTGRTRNPFGAGGEGFTNSWASVGW